MVKGEGWGFCHRTQERPYFLCGRKAQGRREFLDRREFHRSYARGQDGAVGVKGSRYSGGRETALRPLSPRDGGVCNGL